MKSHSGDVSDGNEEQVIGKCRKGDPYCNMAKNLTELCSNILCEVEICVSDETGYLTEEISNMDRMAWFLLTAYSKM